MAAQSKSDETIFPTTEEILQKETALDLQLFDLHSKILDLKEAENKLIILELMQQECDALEERCLLWGTLENLKTEAGIWHSLWLMESCKEHPCEGELLRKKTHRDNLQKIIKQYYEKDK